MEFHLIHQYVHVIYSQNSAAPQPHQQLVLIQEALLFALAAERSQFVPVTAVDAQVTQLSAVCHATVPNKVPQAHETKCAEVISSTTCIFQIFVQSVKTIHCHTAAPTSNVLTLAGVGIKVQLLVELFHVNPLLQLKSQVAWVSAQLVVGAHALQFHVCVYVVTVLAVAFIGILHQHVTTWVFAVHLAKSVTLAVHIV